MATVIPQAQSPPLQRSERRRLTMTESYHLKTQRANPSERRLAAAGSIPPQCSGKTWNLWLRVQASAQGLTTLHRVRLRVRHPKLRTRTRMKTKTKVQFA